MLRTRLIVAFILLPPVLGIVWLGGYPLMALALVAMGIASHEYFSFSVKPNKNELTQYVVVTLLPAIGFILHSFPGLIAFYLLGLVFFSIKAVLFIERPIHEPKFEEAFLHQFATYTFLVAFFCNLIISCSAENSNILILWLLATVMGTDSGAYFSGKMFGNKKLAPRISPNKTIAGSIGGTIIGVSLGVLVAKYIGIEISYPEIIFISFVASLLCQLGDLFQSLIKRFYGVKDSGSILPGHGGMFDRVDGLIFAAPMVYFI